MSRISLANVAVDSDGEELAPIFEGAAYPLIAPGRYEAQCVQGKFYFDPQFRAWKAILRFRLLSSDQQVVGFFHLGRGESPKAGRRSKYMRAWIIANKAPPTKRQTLSTRVFRGKIFEVEIHTVDHSYDQREHPPGMQYSTVSEI